MGVLQFKKTLFPPPGTEQQGAFFVPAAVQVRKQTKSWGTHKGVLMEIRAVTTGAIVLRILSAAILGGILGVERGRKNRAAGLRTYMLVCVGSCLIMLTNQYIYQVFQSGDPVRMGAQVVSGIGFLGAGTIIVTRRSQIRGLTTAAGLWADAAVGLALGVGFYEAAFLGGGIIFVVLTLMQRWDSWMHRTSRSLEVYVEMSPEVGLSAFLRGARELGLEMESVQIIQGDTPQAGRLCFIANLLAKEKTDHEAVCQDLQKLDGVQYLESL